MSIFTRKKERKDNNSRKNKTGARKYSKNKHKIYGLKTSLISCNFQFIGKFIVWKNCLYIFIGKYDINVLIF